MDIYLLRHGRAGESDSSDAARQLTEDGVERLRKVLQVARNARVSPTQIFCSPLVRAVESAEIAAEVLGCRDSVERVDWLQPDSGPEQVLEELGRLGRGQNQAGNDASFLLVGHEPVLGAAVARLLGSTQDVVRFRQGTLVKIEVQRLGPDPHAQLDWILSPDVVGA